MPVPKSDKILCAVALVVFAGTGAWVGLKNSEVKSVASRPARVSLDSADYAAAGIDAPQVETKNWPDPGARAQNREWVYDVFTPPVIYYNAQTGEYSVTPPVFKQPEPEAQSAQPFGVELVEVKLNPFRLQLVGYVGGPGNYRGMFQNTATQETVLARAGKTFPEMALTVRNFEVTRQRVEIPDSMPITQLVATAVVVDDQTGEAVMLSTLERRITGAPSVVLRLGTGEEREDKPGAVFTHAGATYRVGDITLDPPSVQISKESPDLPESQVQTLSPAGAAHGPDAAIEPLPAPATEAASPFPPSF